MRSLVLLGTAFLFLTAAAHADTKADCDAAWKKAPASSRAKRSHKEFLGECLKPQFNLKDYDVALRPILPLHPMPPQNTEGLTLCYGRCNEINQNAVTECYSDPGTHGTTGCVCQEKEYLAACKAQCGGDTYQPKLETCPSP